MHFGSACITAGPAGTVRSLFAFDPNRRAVILLGGDIPLADDLDDAYLREET